MTPSTPSSAISRLLAYGSMTLLLVSGLYGGDPKKEYQDYTKQQYQQRLSNTQATLSNISEHEQLGGMLIPQGTVIYNTTGRKYYFKITSYADPKWLGVYAPIEGYQEGKQELYSYDATIFGSMSVVDKKYVQLGTPKGSVFFNSTQGYMEYVYQAGGSIAQLNSSGTPTFACYFQNGKKIGLKPVISNNTKIWISDDESAKDFPEIVISADFMLNYDILSDLSWGVGVDNANLDTGFRSYFYASYKELRRNYGYWYYDGWNYIQSNLSKLWSPIDPGRRNFYKNKYFYGSLLNIYDRIYLGNVLFYSANRFTGNPVYMFVESKNFLLGLGNKKNWGWDDVNKAPKVIIKGKQYFRGIPSFYNQPFACDWSIQSAQEKDLWIDIFSIEGNDPIRRIKISDFKLGEIINNYVNQRKDLKRKLTTVPQVKYIRYISDDPDGLLYFAVGLDIEEYDYSPLLMAVDREGSLKLLVRLMSAAGDKDALTDSARMGPSFYDYRVVVLPDRSLFQVWNSSQGIGVGKFEVGK